MGDSRRARLEEIRAEKVEHWDALTETIKKMRGRMLHETRPEERQRIRYDIEELELEREQLNAELDEIERRLNDVAKGLSNGLMTGTHKPTANLEADIEKLLEENAIVREAFKAALSKGKRG